MNNIAGEIIGYVAGICTAVCFLPQSVKTIVSKNVRDLSFWSYLLYCLGIFLWFVYGFYIGSVQMIVFNAISLVFAGTTFVMIVRYRSRS